MPLWEENFDSHKEHKTYPYHKKTLHRCENLEKDPNWKRKVSKDVDELIQNKDHRNIKKAKSEIPNEK